jgi:hypothetical protein
VTTKFYLVFDEREDGAKVWTARCGACDVQLVGERAREVTVLTVSKDVPPSQFEAFKQRVRHAWDEARKTGHPIAISDSSVKITKVPDRDGLERALEAHAEICKG